MNPEDWYDATKDFAASSYEQLKDGFNNLVDFTSEVSAGFTRGIVDDISFGLSNCVLDEYQTDNLTSCISYYSGMGTSMAAGCFYGATWLKGGGFCLKTASNSFKMVTSCTKATHRVMECKKVVKIASEASPVAQKIGSVTFFLKIHFAKKTI